MKNKSILEQALLQVQNLEEAVKTNAKGILSSTMKEELNELLKESITQEEEVEVDIDETEDEVVPEENEDMSEQDDEENDEDDSLDMDSEDDVDSVDDMDSEDDVDDFGSGMDTDMDTEMDSDMDADVDADDELGSDFDMDSDLDSMDDDDTLDLTGASDEEILKVFKSMKPEDGVIVKKDNDDISLEMDGDEYLIKNNEPSTSMDELEESEDDDIFFDLDSDEDSDEMSDDDSEEYEIEIDEEEEVEEAARTKWNPHGDKGPGQGRAGLKNKKMFKAGSGNNTALNEEVTKLRKQNQEYKKALILFKDKLNEVAVFNANLAYATRLFTENTTTKQEKLDILKRFDNVNTLNESKGLYKSIKSELVTKKPVTESVVEKLNSTPKTSSSSEVLSESKAYENPQFKRMKELMGKVK